MNLHEYQAKKLLADYGLPVPKGEAVRNVDEALVIAKKMHGMRWVVKAQVHAGGRGKAGGVRLVTTQEELVQATQELLGSRLVTYQTTKEGQPVNQVLIEEPCDIRKELYLGAVIDREKRRVVFIASTEGGVEIEKVAEKTPEKILTVIVDPFLGVQAFQARQLAFTLELQGNQVKQFTQLLLGLNHLFKDNDLSLLEINPLVITQQGDLLCLDAKVNIDDNALYRQSELRAIRDPSQEDERENRARDWELNYIALDGDIGCMVNGAGLAMATMDLIKLNGGNP